MFKTKLFATICAAASTVTVAATALTLAIAGPAGVQSVHTLSANDQIASSIEGIFKSASDSADGVTEFIETVISNKTATNIGFKINSFDAVEDLSFLNGFGGSLELQLDTESEAAALLLETTLGSVAGPGGTIYVDKNEVLAAAPAIFDGMIKIGLDNLEEDLNNSYIGQMISEEIDFDELAEAYETFMSEYAANIPQFDFDSEKFMDGLTDTINNSFDNVMENMKADDLGKQKLNGGSYQAYRAQIPVRELSYIVRDAITYSLNSSEFQSLVVQFDDYLQETTGETLGITATDMKDSATMIDAFWSTVVTELENVLGKNIELTIYITDTVELAGLDLQIFMVDNQLKYSSNYKAQSDMGIQLKCDFTGGENIGDYTDVELVASEGDRDEAILGYTKKSEPNGDFSIVFDAKADGEEFSLTLDGNYVVDGKYFSLVVDSIKFINYGETLFDLGFSIGFKPIDAISKPSGTPVYDVWEMDEEDFMELFEAMEEQLEDISDIFE